MKFLVAEDEPKTGETLPRALVVFQMWDMNFDNDTKVVDIAVHRRRKKTNDDFEPKSIRTIRGMSYVPGQPGSDGR